MSLLLLEEILMTPQKNSPANFLEWSLWALLTFFGLGKLPKMPGSWGSLGGVVVFLLLDHFHLAKWWILLLLACSLAVLLHFLTPWIEYFFGETDPKQVVLDEVAGMLVALTLWVPSPWSLFFHLSAAFLGFRFFDIFKPGPVRWAEKVPGGLGVALDDLVAGFLTALILNGAYYGVFSPF